MKRSRSKRGCAVLVVISLVTVLFIGNVPAVNAGETIKELIKLKRYDEVVSEGGKFAVSPLITALKSNDWKVREEIADTLGKIGAPAVKQLILSIDDSRNYYRWDTTIALGKVGAPAVKPLIAVLKFKNNKVRKYTAIALGRIGDVRAIEPLSKLLKMKYNPVRRWSAWSLGKIGDKSAIDPLTSALKDEDVIVRRNATLALGEINDPMVVETLVMGLGDEAVEVRAASAYAIGMLADEVAVMPLIASFKDDQFIVRANAERALGKIGKPAVDFLIESIKDDASDVRKHSAGALGRIGDARAIEPLSKLSADNNGKVRRSAAIALGDFKDEKAAKILIKLLDDSDLRVRNSAFNALIRTGTPAISSLIDIAYKGDKQQEAIEILGAIGDPRALKVLIESVNDEKPNVKMAAVKGLGRLKDKQILGAALPFLDDSDEFARYFAAEALINSGWEPKSGDDKLDYFVAAQSWPDVIELKGEAVGRLTNMLDSKSVSFKKGAIATLGDIGDDDAVDSLIPLVEKDKIGETVLEALKKITKEDFGQDKGKWKSWRKKQ